jgi:hypothetical protein
VAFTDVSTASAGNMAVSPSMNGFQITSGALTCSRVVVIDVVRDSISITSEYSCWASSSFCVSARAASSSPAAAVARRNAAPYPTPTIATAPTRAMTRARRRPVP